MTPFQLRRRLRELLKEDAQPDRLEVTLVLPDGREHSARSQAGGRLIELCRGSPLPMVARCADGRCGACAVQVLEGQGLSPAGTDEQELLAAGVGEAYAQAPRRLACHATVQRAGARVGQRYGWTMEWVEGEDLRGS